MTLPDQPGSKLNPSGLATDCASTHMQTMLQGDLVSVSMSVFNAERFLAGAINSVLKQSYSNFEFIIVDDGSTDSSPKILARFAALDSRIRVIRQRNEGPPSASNAGLAAASSDIVIKLDSDDLMLPNRIERQVAFMLEHPEVSVASSYAYLIDSQNRIVGKSHPVVDVELGRTKRDPSHFVNIIHPACVMRKSHMVAAGGYPLNLRFGDDRELWGRLATSGRKLAVQPEYLLEQRIHGGSLTLEGMRTHEIACRFVDSNIVRRFDGVPEQTYEEFVSGRAKQPLLARMQSWSDDASSMLYKKATRDFAERRWFNLLKHSFGAIALRPSNALRMIRKSASAPRERVLLQERG